MTKRVALVLVLQAGALLVLGAILGTWQDEEFTLATTAHGIGYAIQRAITYELQPPLYFAFVAALRTVSGSVFFARAISAVFAVATTYVGALLARRIWPERDPWIFAALVATNPFVVFAGLEIRVYALGLLESSLLFLLLDSGFVRGTDARARAGFFACALAALYTQYFLAFDLLGCVAALVALRRVRAALVCGALVAAAFALLLPLALAIPGQAAGTLSVEPPPPGAAAGVWRPFDYIVAPDFATLAGRFGRYLDLGLKLLAVLLVVRGWPRWSSAVRAGAAIMLVAYVCYTGIQVVLHAQLVPPRHFLAEAWPEALLAYALVASFRIAHAGRYAAALAAVTLLSNASALAATYGSLAKLGDAARVGPYLSREARPGDAIAVWVADAAPAVERYYRGPLTIREFPSTRDPNHYNVDASLIRSRTQALAAFDALPRVDHLWFVELGICDRSDVHGCRELESAMTERYTIVGRKAFFKTTVYELAPRALAPVPERPPSGAR